MSRAGGGSPYLRQLRLACAFAAQAPLASQRLLARINSDQGRALLEGGAGPLYSTLFVPGEIFAALGLAPTPYEPIVGLMASAPDVDARLDLGAGARFACEICSYQALFRGLLVEEAIPAPLGLVASTFVCEDVRGMCEHLAHEYGRPLFVLDVPCTEDDASVRYVAAQLEELAGFAAACSGRSLSADGLRAALRRSNEALALKQEIDELRAAHPGIAGGGLGFQLFTLYPRFGAQSTIDVLRAVLDELSEKAASVPGSTPTARILWVDIIPWYANGMIAYLERERGAAVVYEELNAFDWPPLDEERPWESLARKVLCDHRLGAATRRAARVRELVRRFAANAVVCYSHAQCRVTPTTVELVGDSLREMGVPWVELHGDVIDRRGAAAAQNHLRLEALMEMVR